MIAIIDSGGANITSVRFAIERLGLTAELTSDPQTIEQASHIILPGVGAAKDAMATLQKSKLLDVIKNLSQPVLGICLGMQILYQHSQEGDVECLGIIPGEIKHFPEMDDLPVPHMGWNTLNIHDDRTLLTGLKNQHHVYFVHSYHAPVNECTLASCHYGVEFSAVVQYENFFATQFHPEKSAAVGTKILQNFLES